MKTNAEIMRVAQVQAKRSHVYQRMSEECEIQKVSKRVALKEGMFLWLRAMYDKTRDPNLVLLNREIVNAVKDLKNAKNLQDLEAKIDNIINSYG